MHHKIKVIPRVPTIFVHAHSGSTISLTTANKDYLVILEQSTGTTGIRPREEVAEKHVTFLYNFPNAAVKSQAAQNFPTSLRRLLSNLVGFPDTLPWGKPLSGAISLRISAHSTTPLMGNSTSKPLVGESSVSE